MSVISRSLSAGVIWRFKTISAINLSAGLAKCAPRLPPYSRAPGRGDDSNPCQFQTKKQFLLSTDTKISYFLCKRFVRGWGKSGFLFGFRLLKDTKSGSFCPFLFKGKNGDVVGQKNNLASFPKDGLYLLNRRRRGQIF